MRINKDNVINAICIFGIVVSICFMLIVMLKSFYGQEIEISFIKDIFSIGATLFAALIAISLFNDWKELHNKQVQNDFALKTYNQFKKFELALFKANDTFSNLSNIIDWFNEIELPLDDSKVVEKRNEMNLMFSQVHEAENEFMNFMSQLVDYCVVTNQEDKFLIIQKDLYRQFFKFYKNEDELSYSSYNQFWKNYSDLFDEYLSLRKNTYKKVIKDILDKLQEHLN
ncbi:MULTISPECIES: hypothetical protein [Acinetobacter calcoaceticus/baumannii complex]|uniref:hypothetical protein n=1 Tax=Acinetobacter calcoaceticus/baumannii complex TaxID=909768 RepID=UPI0027B87F66|nr:hypothetical protein [Acinetobacter baumannii]MDV7419095.1 hypothetical protein [Acinetobacter baumannii]